MSSTETKYQITRLNGLNYFMWRYRVQMLLKEKGIWSCIDTEKPTLSTGETDALKIAEVTQWERNDEKALATIALTIDDGQIQHIRDATSAKLAWNALKQFHERDTPGNRVHVLREIMRSHVDETGDVEKHVSDMNELFQKLMSLGTEIKPEFFKCATLLGSLPKSYDSLITALDARKPEELTADLVMTSIIAEYRRRKERGNGSREEALKITTGSRKFLRKKKEVVCYHCDHPGHIVRDCPEIKNKSKKGFHKKSENSVSLAKDNDSDCELLFMTSSKIDGYILDSGATCHCVGSMDEFIDFDEKHSEKVGVANGEEMTAEGKGTIRTAFLNEKNEKSVVKIPNVLYIPGIGANLLSVRKLAERGLRVIFNDRTCEIITQKGAQVAFGDVSGKLYKLRSPQKVYVAKENSHRCVHRWHEILGHRDIEVIKTLATSGLVKGVEIAQCDEECRRQENCAVCLEGKMSRKKFPKRSENRADETLGLIHSDVCGPMQTETPSRKRYVLTFIDDFSRFTTVYLLREKSEVFGKFQDFAAMGRNMFGRNIKCIRSDRGGEFMDGEFNEYLAKRGIKSQRTAPSCPEQNGKAERKNRTLIGMARCMLLDAGLPNKFWGEAVMMANFVQNRLPAKYILKTPHELWYGTVPNLKNFRKFGAKCFVHKPDEQRRKLDPKGIKGVLVGYDLNSKAYRVYVPSTDKVVISRDVQFVEKDSHWKSIKVNMKKSNRDFVTKAKESTECRNESSVEVSVDESENNSVPVGIFSENDDAENFQETFPEQSAENSFIEGDILSSTALMTDDESTLQAADEDGDATVIDRNLVESEPKMVRFPREKKGVPPRRLIEEINMTIKTGYAEPETYNQAIKSKEKKEWRAAMMEEMQSMVDNRTWDIVDLPKDRDAIGSRWVFKVKTDAEGKRVKYKARLVAQGYNQKFGTDYDRVFAPVVRQTTFRALLAIAAQKKMRVIHFDAKTAFLNGKLDETIYMKQPPGFIKENEEHRVCLLRRSIYGLKQSARIWNETLREKLSGAGYVQSKNDPCLYVKIENGVACYVLIYVDDINVASESDRMIQDCEKTLKEDFEINNLGEIENYLGLRVERDADGIYSINQTAYINRVVAEFELTNAKTSPCPLSPSYGKSREEYLLPDNKAYQKAIGCLLYISVNTRPDISAAVSILAQKVCGPTYEDWNEIKRTLKYLKGTAAIKLKLGTAGSRDELEGYADANFAENRGRKSNSGYIFMLFGAAISWSCKRQTCVAMSSTESEFIALSEACKEAQWLRRLLSDFQLEVVSPTIIHEDNQSCLEQIKEEKFSDRSKHVDTRVYFVKDHVDKGEVRCIYCPTEDMLGDMLTKPLSGPRLMKLRKLCGLE